jgi:hypothetical protein
VCGSFAHGKSCGGPGLDGIGLLAAEEGSAIVLVALRIAAGGTASGRPAVVRARREKAVQEVEQVVGVLAGGVQADEEMDGALALDNLVKALAEGGVAGGRARSRTTSTKPMSSTSCWLTRRCLGSRPS